MDEQQHIARLQAEIEALQAENKRLRDGNLAAGEQLVDPFIARCQQRRQAELPTMALAQQLLAEFGECLQLDSVVIYRQQDGVISPQISVPPQPPLTAGDDARDCFPWLTTQLLSGSAIVCASIEELPEQAAEAAAVMRTIPISALLVLPLHAGDELVAVLAANIQHGRRDWSDAEVALARAFLIVITELLRSCDSYRQQQLSTELLNAVLDISDTGYWLWERGRGVSYDQHRSQSGPVFFDEKADVLFDRIHPDDQAEARDKFQRCMDLAEAYECRYRARVDSGEWHWFQLQVNAVERDHWGRALRIVCAYTDITGFVEQQQLMQESWSQADSANTAKSEFLARMSHEIRTPMNAVLGMSHLLSGTELTPRQEEYLDGIVNSAGDLLNIINDILDFSKIEAGRLDIDEHDFHLDKLVDQIASIFSLAAAKKSLEVIYDIEDSLVRNLRGDGERLKQILINLVSNAIKFTERGQVVLKAWLMESGEKQLSINFSVTDTGIGLSAAQIDNLFKPFEQADGSTSRRYGGSGLGLSIAKRLVELMGGSISVQSEKGQGACFSFYLPFRYGALDEPVSRISSCDLSKMRALVVDDNDQAREIISRTVASLGLETAVAENGKRAVNMVFNGKTDKSQHYDVIFMDYRMPELDGITAAKLIKGEKSLPTAPAVVMISACDYSVIGEEAEGSIDAFINKPVSRSRLFDTLAELFGRGEVKTSVDVEPQELSRLQGLQLLLVEDNIVNQKVAQGILGKQGVAVDIANHGVEALEMLSNRPPNYYRLVLMDMEMPEMDGFTATGEIRKNPDWQGLPIVAMTAHAIKGDRERCLAAGMDGYISKPVSPKLMYKTILELLAD